ncbi:YchJ family protein [Chitinispirillales bacterium ANBcel5]|uniref:YchJ family protein n=1 Tax=Cellulosispirillum alkaliphilum TaxID=3039283 RepID=UPI002A501ADE|nr:YchJ family protein [Chitinispirillales bacterium ANBcel5]
MEKCSCNSGLEYKDCCEPCIKGTGPAQTAEAIIRARYTAYVRGAVDFILSSTHPDRRSECDEKAIKEWSANSQWEGLKIISTSKGGVNDEEGEVEFIASFSENRIKKDLHETGMFKRIDGAWYYLDGKIHPQKPFIRKESKVMRNDPCTCGSGKKFKKCCMVE